MAWFITARGMPASLRYLDPVTPVRGAGFDGIKEDDLVVVFYRVQVCVLHRVHDFRQGRQFEVMGGEQGKGPGRCLPGKRRRPQARASPS